MPYANTAPQRHQIVFILAVVAAVLQVALAPQISILGGRFNFMLAFALAIALRGDGAQAVYAGFFAGLFYDLTATVPVGLMALLTMLASFALSSIGGAGTSGFSGASLRLAAAGALAVSIVNGIVLVVLGAEGNLLISLGHGLMTAILTSIACIPFLMVAGTGSSLGGGSFSRPGARAGSGGSRFKQASKPRGARRFR
ncbi:hypothetical protein [Enorma sp.]|uniref:hypothetical protein n=1 Tax=Enorma sp. TaxID=1920692 RepID=UPI0025C194EF|nr:hypothetical protein [Enorma sp.]